MNTYAADVAELVAKLDLRDAIHIGHSTGGGELHGMWRGMAPVAWRRLS
jgi:pimeloyl-ACP methyl ester carboxylesterase